MRSDLAALKISDRELERLTGCDVGDIFIGGVFGGTYRISALQNPKKLIALGLTEAVVFLLIVVFTLPLSLFLTSGANGIADASSILRFLFVAFGIAIALLLAWNLYMKWQGKHLRSLMRLLDEVDRYEEMLSAIAVLDRLETANIARNLNSALQNRAEILEAIHLTRDNLIAGLTTEKILRENRGLLARQQDLLASIETNLSLVRSLEVKHQADEYGQFLNEALQIGISVHQEVQRLN
jgi:uncharacterized membrane protein YccC